MTVSPGDALFGRDGTDDVAGLAELEPPPPPLPMAGPAAVRQEAATTIDAPAPTAGPAAPVRSRPTITPAAPPIAPPHPTAGRRAVDPGPRPDARPRIVEDPGILGLSRHSRGRIGARLFTLFFVVVFGVILLQLVVRLLNP